MLELYVKQKKRSRSVPGTMADPDIYLVKNESALIEDITIHKPAQLKKNRTFHPNSSIHQHTPIN